MDNLLIEIRNLSISYKASDKKAVESFNLDIKNGQSIAIVGESGSGKSSLALAIMGMLNDKAKVEGSMKFCKEQYNMNNPSDWEHLKWSDIAIVFQNAVDILNPLMKVYKQVSEPIQKHLNLKKAESDIRARNLLSQVGLDEDYWEAYPHQLSGGMRQKVLIAMALSCNPKLLIVDEPTMSLDPDAKMGFVNLIKKLQKENNFGLLLISHELSIVRHMCSHIHIMYNGFQFEYGKLDEVIDLPKHPYTKGLISSSWEIDSYKDIWGIPQEIRDGESKGCPFYSRCFQAEKSCLDFVLKNMNLDEGHIVNCKRGGIAKILEVKSVCKNFSMGRKKTCAAQNVSFDLYEGEVLALIGSSGSGKSTLANIISGFEQMDKGEIYFKGCNARNISLLSHEFSVQVVVQDPSSAMNPNWSVEEIVYEPLKKGIINAETKDKLLKLFKELHLPVDEIFLNKKAKALSGGQKQRVAIARALLMSPKVLIADEVTAMLDPSSASNLIKLLKGMQNRHGFSMILITHDIILARKIADRVVVLEKGNITSCGHCKRILDKRLDKLCHTKIKEEHLS